jgi:hypothetical protein
LNDYYQELANLAVQHPDRNYNSFASLQTFLLMDKDGFIQGFSYAI